MNTWKLAFCAALAPLFFGSCILHIGGGGTSSGSKTHFVSSSSSSKSSPATIARENRAGLEKLEVGMTVADVRALMCEGWTQSLASPYREDSFPTADGMRGEVLFYYTNTRDSDGLVTEDELTPIYFEDGVLVGWGSVGFDAWKRRVLGE